MSLDQTKLIDMYERLFAEPGWKELVEDLTDKRENLKTAILESQSPYEQVQFLRGLAAGYRYILGIEGLIEQAKQQGLPDVAV